MSPVSGSSNAHEAQLPRWVSFVGEETPLPAGFLVDRKDYNRSEFSALVMNSTLNNR